MIDVAPKKPLKQTKENKLECLVEFIAEGRPRTRGNITSMVAVKNAHSYLISFNYLGLRLVEQGKQIFNSQDLEKYWPKNLIKYQHIIYVKSMNYYLIKMHHIIFIKRIDAKKPFIFMNLFSESKSRMLQRDRLRMIPGDRYRLITITSKTTFVLINLKSRKVEWRCSSPKQTFLEDDGSNFYCIRPHRVDLEGYFEGFSRSLKFTLLLRNLTLMTFCVASRRFLKTSFDTADHPNLSDLYQHFRDESSFSICPKNRYVCLRYSVATNVRRSKRNSSLSRARSRFDRGAQGTHQKGYLLLRFRPDYSLELLYRIPESGTLAIQDGDLECFGYLSGFDCKLHFFSIQINPDSSFTGLVQIIEVNTRTNRLAILNQVSRRAEDTEVQAACEVDGWFYYIGRRYGKVMRIKLIEK